MLRSKLALQWSKLPRSDLRHSWSRPNGSVNGYAIYWPSRMSSRPWRGSTRSTRPPSPKRASWGRTAPARSPATPAPPCRYSHSIGNINITLNKARSDLARAEGQLKERDRTYLEQEHLNNLLQSHLIEATNLLQRILAHGQSCMPSQDIESIHDFFKLSNGGHAD